MGQTLSKSVARHAQFFVPLCYIYSLVNVCFLISLLLGQPSHCSYVITHVFVFNLYLCAVFSVASFIYVHTYKIK